MGHVKIYQVFKSTKSEKTQNLGGMPPPRKTIGGAKVTAKIAKYLVFKGENFFNDTLKTCFLDDSRGVSEKNFESPKISAKIEF